MIANSKSLHSDILTNRVILKVSLKRTFLGKRGVTTLILATLFALYPIIGIYRVITSNETIFPEGAMYGFHSYFSFLYELVIIPLIISVFASYIISDDIVDKTITYWLVRPIRRTEIYISKIAALIIGTFTIAFILEMVNFVSFYIIAKIRGEFVDWRLFFFHLLVIFIVVLYYSIITAIISLAFPVSILISMLYIILWELAIYAALMDLGAVGIKWFFIHYYLIQLQNIAANTVFGFHYPIAIGIAGIIILFSVLFLAMSALFLTLSKRKEYP